MLDFKESFVKVNDVNLKIIEKGEGPTVLFLHGFPDSSYLWRYQMERLAQEGYHTLAIDQRGFGESDKPKEVDNYQMKILVEDVKGVMDHLNIESAYVVAHDWGANVGWALAAKYPEKVKKYVPIASGYPVYNKTQDGYEKSWYVYAFLFKNVAEELFSKDNFYLLRQWGRNHSETEKWVKDMSRPGALTAAFNWYRANYAPENKFAVDFEYKPIDMPTMGIFGIHDPFLEEIRMINSTNYVNNKWRYERVYDAGHWVQLDKPNYINYLLLEFFDEKGE